MKTIRFRQVVQVEEVYDTSYSAEDFAADCRYYDIQNLTFDELCSIMDNEEEVMITINENYYDFDKQAWQSGPHMVDAFEFFSGILCQEAYDAGYVESSAVDIAETYIGIENDLEDSYPC